jgi:hypothetical protein
VISAPNTTEAVDLEALLADQDPAAPDERHCHLQAVKQSGTGALEWNGGRPLCGSPRATRCPGARLIMFGGEACCRACHRPICPQCAAQERGATS